MQSLQNKPAGKVETVAKAHPLARPVVVHSRADVATELAKIRVGLGLTCLALDDHAGFHDGYTAKLEHGDKPSGRQGFHISPMAEVWLEALGCRLVLMSAEQADAVGAVAMPKRETVH